MTYARFWMCGLAVGICVAGLFAAAPPTTGKAPIGPLAPAAARASVELEPGLDAELMASEPMVTSPCAIAFDEHGRCFVAENIGYPTGNPTGEPVGTIALLEDTKGAGVFDKRTTFASSLTFPNGVMPWRGGLIVSCAPDVLFLKDSKGDGHADVREVLLTGFDTTRSTQLRVNGPTLGPDGWIYLSGGLSGGIVYSPKHPEKKLDSKHADVRFRPDTGEIELVDGKGQFGQSFDDAGHRFVCMNRIQVQHAPLPARYLARNPKVSPPEVLQDCSDIVLNALLGHVFTGASRLYPISANLTTADSHAGTYTAACGVHIARGDSLPAEYVGAAWSCEPTGNLARADTLESSGGTFHARRMHEQTDAFRSRDDWLRPVFLADGPDGALYICDMYRKIIEHPDYLPVEIRRRGDFAGGKGMGRIWRVFGNSFDRTKLAEKSAGAQKALADANFPEKLTALLASPNGWTRDTAFRLITERGPADAVAPLSKMLAADIPVAARIACLHLLNNAGALTDDQLQQALKNPAATVREVAVGLAEPRLASEPKLAETVVGIATDADVHVRYAVALAAGDIPDQAAAVNALVQIVARDADDKWFRLAIETSVPTPEAQWSLLTNLASHQSEHPGVGELLQSLVRVMNTRADEKTLADNLARLLNVLANADYPTRASALVGFSDRGAKQLRTQASAVVSDTLAGAARTATDGAAPTESRVQAAALLGIAGNDTSAKTLLSLVSPSQPADVATAAMLALAQSRDASAMAQLLVAAKWNQYPPTLHHAIISAIIGRPELARPLIDAIESNAVPLTAINPSQRDWLKKLPDEALRSRALKLMAGDGIAPDRNKTYEQTKAAVMPLKPAPAHGQKVFRDNCTSCHRLDREGVAVGPDLLDIRNLPKETILLHIVIPELEIAPNFTCYNCVTRDGRTITGIMMSDTPQAITLRQPLALDETIQRDQIETLSASKLSLMPQGLEKVIPPQDMADLLAYLRGE